MKKLKKDLEEDYDLIFNAVEDCEFNEYDLQIKIFGYGFGENHSNYVSTINFKFKKETEIEIDKYLPFRFLNQIYEYVKEYKERNDL